MSDWDIESHRSSHEPMHHWELKKTFMESIKHMFDEQRVVCLAQTLGNIEFYGCRYPSDTMTQIQELARDILEEFRAKRGNRLQRTFVSGSTAANAKVNRTNALKPGEQSSKRSSEEAASPEKKMKYSMFVAATKEPAEEESTGFKEGFVLPPIKAQQRGIDQEIAEEEERLRVLEERMQQRLNKMQELASNQHHEQRLQEKTIEEVEEPKRQFKMASYNQSLLREGEQLRMNYSFPLHNFILVTLSYVPDENSCSVLQRSAGFSKMQVHWDYQSNSCYVQIAGHEVCRESRGSKPEARDAATKRAIEILDEYCYKVEIKNKYLSDGTEVDLIDVEDNTKVGGKKDALGSSNVGHKLLSLMGWAGGGLGRDGGGIAEPITAKSVFGRDGLGTIGTGKHFKQKIQKIVQEYIGSHSPYDLVFTTGFDNEQRKVMHEIARRFGLKSKSFGKGDSRHLTISRKLDPRSMLEDLAKRGGESEKYILKPPANFL